MNNQQMQALTCKELEYISDSISNESMQIKLCSTIASTTQNQAIRQACQQYVQTHEQHLQTLTDCLRQHEPLAPTQLQ
jgi:23S rRNA maturation mini-RNase III